MRSEAGCLGGISLHLQGSHLGEMKIFDMNTHKWASAARWIELSFFLSFFFKMLTEYYKSICSA